MWKNGFRWPHINKGHLFFIFTYHHLKITYFWTEILAPLGKFTIFVSFAKWMECFSIGGIKGSDFSQILVLGNLMEFLDKVRVLHAIFWNR
jgi:hypothetical protein